MHEGLNAAGRELGLNVAGKESAGLVILLQHGVKVRDREPSDEQVRLFARTKFGNRMHFLLQVI